MPKISVIVPVYNTEKYLRKCLDSILNQTYQDFEIIIINDGSTDGSEKIINEYKEKNSSRIKYYVQQNAGLSSARNVGIEKAKGEYLSFIDSDDYIDKDLFQNLKQEIDKDIDLIKFKLIKVDENYNEIERVKGPIFTEKNGQDAFNSLVFNDVLLEPACIYLYKKELFTNNNFKFAIGKYHEDFGLIPLTILKSKLVSSLDVYGYYYMQTNQSITRNSNYERTIKRANDLLVHYDNMIIQINKWNLTKTTLENVKQYYINAILDASRLLINKEDIDSYCKEIKKRKLLKNIKVKNVRSFVKKIVLTIKYARF